MSGQKIIDGLNDVLAGNFERVTVTLPPARWFPAAMLDDKDRCCGRKPIAYKGGSWRSPQRPQRFCSRCDRAYGLHDPHQIENWAFKESDGGFLGRKD